MSEKQNESFGLGSDFMSVMMYVSYFPQNYEQSGWSKRKFHPALGCCHQL